MHSFTVHLSLLVTTFLAVQAVPIPSFRDVERAWKEGQSEAEIHAATADYHPTPSWRNPRHSNDPAEPSLEGPRTTIEISIQSRVNDDSVEQDRSTNKLSSLLDDWALHYLLPTSASATSKASVAGHLNEHKKGVHHRHHHRHRHTHRHHGVDTTGAVQEFEHALDERTIAARSRGFSVEVRAEKRQDEADTAPVLRPVRGLAWNMA